MAFDVQHLLVIFTGLNYSQAFQLAKTTKFCPVNFMYKTMQDLIITASVHIYSIVLHNLPVFDRGVAVGRGPEEGDAVCPASKIEQE